MSALRVENKGVQVFELEERVEMRGADYGATAGGLSNGAFSVRMYVYSRENCWIALSPNGDEEFGEVFGTGDTKLEHGEVSKLWGFDGAAERDVGRGCAIKRDFLQEAAEGSGTSGGRQGRPTGIVGQAHIKILQCVKPEKALDGVWSEWDVTAGEGHERGQIGDEC